jgi:hypothetical protein
MLMYSDGTKLNVVVTLDQIETAVILLSHPAAQLDPDYAKRHSWVQAVSKAMLTRGSIHLIVMADKSDTTLRGFHGPLSALPQPYRRRVSAAMEAVAMLFQHVPFTDGVDCIGENSLT